MPIRILFLVLSSFVFASLSGNASAVEGMISVASQHSVDETVTKLTSALETKGMKIFAIVPHSKGAESADIKLRPTTLLIFGNPKVGAPLMSCTQTVGLDLPQKALIHEDEKGVVYLSYNDPNYLKNRHAIEGCDEVLGKVSNALKNFANAATQ
jgi:uncharacterized protein (DUF302 family)